MAIRGILLDTNAYAAFKRGSPEAVDILRHVPLIGLNSVVLGELLSGFAVGTHETRNRQELKEFLASDRVDIFSIGYGTAEHYASIYKNLKQIGKPIPTNDMWIAATALEFGLAVFSYDNHFKVVNGIISGSHLSDFEI